MNSQPNVLIVEAHCVRILHSVSSCEVPEAKVSGEGALLATEGSRPRHARDPSLLLRSAQDCGSGSHKWRVPIKSYYVYIMTNKSKTLYTGVTNNLERRVYEHKHKLVAGFTSRYNITKLVYYQETNDVQEALLKEKQIKGWLRSKKITLIETENPEWKDLSLEWYS